MNYNENKDYNVIIENLVKVIIYLMINFIVGKKLVNLRVLLVII